ncbi:hypothetical protein [Brevundimonas sp. GN22]
MNTDKLPEFLKPRLRLFLSADIVGSTSLKQSRLANTADKIREQQKGWFTAIQGFYIEAKQAVSQSWSDIKENNSNLGIDFGDDPIVWKTIGDEVIFVKHITDYRQVAVMLKCWISSLDEMRSFLKETDSKLDVKSTAWLAGFPVENKEVVISLDQNTSGVEIEDYFEESGNILNKYYSSPENSKPNDISLDFIGPAIDIGFRLGGHSSSRKFVISVGIAYILSLTNPAHDGLVQDFDPFYDGSVVLKGVLGGMTYPIFWIDLSKDKSLARHEDQLTGYTPPGRDKIRRYCESFYSTHQSYLFRPFICTKHEQQLNIYPSWYEELLVSLAKNYNLKLDPSTEPPEVPETDLEINKAAEMGSVVVGMMHITSPEISTHIENMNDGDDVDARETDPNLTQDAE